MPGRGHESEISGQNEGKVNTVRYEAVNAMLLNEFLKEHRKNEEQEATIAQSKAGTCRSRGLRQLNAR